MKLASLKEGQFVETGGYYTKGDAGQAKYLIVAAQAADGYGDHTLANGTVAVLQVGDVANVREFGAKANGEDDSDAIQAALDYRFTVHIPQGLYHITKALIIRNSQKVYGNATIKIKDGSYTDTNFWMMTNTVKAIPYDYNPAIAFAQNIRIEGLKFDGNASGASMTGNVGAIFLDQVDFSTIDKVSISNINQGNGGLSAIRVFYCNSITVSDCNIKDTDRQNIASYESTISILDCNLINSKEREPILCSTQNPLQYQASIANIARCEIVNTVTTNGTHVLRFSGESSGSIKNCVITGNNTLNGVYIVDVADQNIELQNNTIKNCLYGVHVETESLRYLRLRGNKYEGCANGIRYDALSLGGTVQVDGDIIDSTDTPIYVNSVSNAIIKNCTIQSGVNCSLLGIESLIFSDNIITGLTNASYAVFINGTAQAKPFVIGGNMANGNTTDNIRAGCNAIVNGNSARIITGSTSFIHVSCVGDGYIWSNSGTMYVRPFGFPSSLTDGTIIGTQS